MTTRQMMLPKLTIGLDLGDRFSQLCVLDARGQIRATERLRTTPAALERYGATLPRCRIVLEVGTHSPWVSRLLQRLMGRSSLPGFTARLISAGRHPCTPAARIQSATTPGQRVTVATLAIIADAAERDGLEAPVVTVIGEVARLAAEGGMPLAIRTEVTAIGGI